MAIAALLRAGAKAVIAGLDPAIHPSSYKLFYKEDGCAGQARA
jgi:hypothetical protein